MITPSDAQNKDKHDAKNRISKPTVVFEINYFKRFEISKDKSMISQDAQSLNKLNAKKRILKFAMIFEFRKMCGT